MTAFPQGRPDNDPTTPLDRIADRSASVAVIGQGYVGLTLAIEAAMAGFSVTGFDIDRQRIAALDAGIPDVPGVEDEAFFAARATGRLRFDTAPDRIGSAQVIVICVPTPVSDHAPDLRPVERAGRSVAAAMRPGALIVLESTTYPGTTDDLLRPILERGSGYTLDDGFFLAYSPERIDPGNAAFGMRNTPRVVGGCSTASIDAAVAFYSTLVDKVVPVSTPRVAETAKLLENTFRHINIALVNELAMLCHELGIDVWEVVEAAATKPFGFMPFTPGPGVGGHCIPLDPTYLAWQIRRESGRRFGVLEAAQDVNERMPNYIVSRVTELLNDHGRSVRGARILVLGVTYKPDVGDVRESPALQTMLLLYRKGADVRFHDYFVERVPLNGGEVCRVEDLDAEVEGADLVLCLTPHSAYDLTAIAEQARIVFDTRNAFDAGRPSNVVTL